MPPDAELLQQFVRDHSQTAFTALVQRHVTLVYSAALRRCGDSSRAEEVTQDVFIMLARKSGALLKHPSLVGWLYLTTHHLAAKSRRSLQRRAEREQSLRAMSLQTDAPTDELDWNSVRPVIDESLLELKESDRLAVLLRFFAGQSHEQIGHELGLNANATRMRLDRALEKLRAALNRRGVTSTTTALGAALSAHAIVAPPAGFAATIALGASSTVPATAWFLLMQSSTTKVALVSMALATTTAGFLWQRHENSMLREELAQLRGRLEQQTSSSAAPKTSPLTTETNSATVQTQMRAEVAELKNSPAALWEERAALLREMVAQVPALNIPELQLASEEDWLDAAKEKLASEEDYRRALAKLRNLVVMRFSSQVSRALQQYRKGNPDSFPTDPAQLEPFMEHSLGPAVWKRYEVQPAAQTPNLKMGGNSVITLRAPLDEEYDNKIVIGPNGTGMTLFRYLVQRQVVDALTHSFKAANPQAGSPAPADLLPYARTDSERKTIQSVIEQNRKP